MLHRIVRYALNTLTALSLLLCVATVGLWVRSECGPFVDLIAWNSIVDASGWHSGFTLIARRGYIAMWTERSQSDSNGPPGWTVIFRRGEPLSVVDDGPDTPAFFGVSHRYSNGLMPSSAFDRPPRPYTERFAAISSPLLVTLLLIAPAYWWISRRRMNRPGFCPACGYDLRATPDRCPNAEGR